MNDWVQLTETSSSIQASILVVKLHAANIEAQVVSSKDSAYQMMLGGTQRIYVQAGDADAAKAVVDAFVAAQEEE